MAEAETPPPAEEQDDVNALESPDNAGAEAGSLEDDVKTDKDGTIDATSAQGAQATGAVPAKPKGRKAFLKRFNIYLLLFVFILLIGGGILVIAYFQSKKASTTNTFQTADLTEEALRQLANGSDATVGSTGQILNVQSSAIFAGKVLIRDGLEIASNLRVGGTAALTNLTVTGTSQLGQVQINNNLSVAADAAVQGSLTARSLQVSGAGTFSGPVSAPQVTTTNLQLNGDLVLTNHVVAGGPTPSLARGPALGSGGSASISGSDTSGTVNINVGGGPAAGCFATLTFARKFNSTPHVTITPVGADGGALDYYVTRSATGFSICDATAAPAGSSFAFDYFVAG